MGLVALVAAVWVIPEPTGPGPAIACRVAVFVEGELRCGDEIPPSARWLNVGDAMDGDRRARMDPGDLRALALPVDVNGAGPAELASLPRIGPTLAGRVVAARPFETVDELESVKGIGPKTLAGLRARARIGPTPIPR